MANPHRLHWHLLAPTLAAGLFSPSLSARPNGFAAECGGCHYGELEGGGTAPSPIVTALAGASRVEPGDTVDITVNVESTWPDALVAGFLILTDANSGVFTPSEEGTGNVGLEEGEALDYAIGHTAARDLIEGATTFEASWTAPATTGTYEFAVYAVTSDDGDGMDEPDVAEETNDPFGKFAFKIGVGCDLVSYFYDADMDGFGADEELFCDPPTGYVLQGGDCRDDDPAVNPDAVELCSFTDENCDGEPMAPPTFYLDVDGDGYGVASEILPGTCTMPDGYAAQAGDCAPSDPAVHPSADEVSGNGVDDNCNGVVDELGVAPVATQDASGVEPAGSAAVTPGAEAPPVGETPGSSAPDLAPTAPLTSAAPGEMPPAAAATTPVLEAPMPTPTQAGSPSGCSVSRPGGTPVGLEVGVVLFCAGFMRRRLKASCAS